jgi:HEAT repeat protein
MSKKRIEQIIAENILVFRQHIWASNEYAVENLVALGKRAVIPLRDALSDPDAFVRAGIAQTLRKLGDQQAVPVLETAAQNRQLAPGNIEGDVTQARIQAVIALGALGNASSAITLRSIVEDKTNHPWLRGQAATALGKVRSYDSYDLLQQTFTSSSEEDEARRGAAEGLGFLGDPQAVNQLVLVLDKLILQESDWPLKSSIARALGLLKDKRAVESLIRLLKDDRAEVLIQATLALGNIGDTTALPDLAWLQSNCDDRFLGFAIKHYATEAIQKINEA